MNFEFNPTLKTRFFLLIVHGSSFEGGAAVTIADPLSQEEGKAAKLGPFPITPLTQKLEYTPGARPHR